MCAPDPFEEIENVAAIEFGASRMQSSAIADMEPGTAYPAIFSLRLCLRAPLMEDLFDDLSASILH